MAVRVGSAAARAAGSAGCHGGDRRRRREANLPQTQGPVKHRDVYADRRRPE